MFWSWDLNLGPPDFHALALKYLSEKKNKRHPLFLYLKENVCGILGYLFIVILFTIEYVYIYK